MISKFDAIVAIDPNASFETRQEPNEEEVITWLNGYTPIADDVIAAKQEELRLATAHIAPRKSSYPSILEQLDMQYWDQVNGTTTWKDAIAKVKSDNPKSE